MNNQQHTHTPTRRTLLRSFVSLLALTAGLASTTRAADWYLKANQPHPNSWASPVTDWAANPNGTGASPASIGPADTFYTNGRTLRTPAITGNATFPGGVLGLNGGVIGIKTGSAAFSIAPKLVSTAGSIESWGTPQNFRADDWENLAPATTFTTIKASANQTLKFSVGTLTGSGETRISGGGTVRFDVTNAENYLGTVRVSGAKVDFDNDVFCSGPLVIEAGATAVLDQAVSFSGLTVGATVYPPDNYTLSELQAAHPGVFTGTSAGSITVRTPRTWYLTVSQGAQDWTAAYLSNWNAATNGSGAAPTSVNGFDTYSVSVGTNVLRTPAVTSTFTGGTLALGGSGQLVLNGTGSAVSTVPTLSSTGGTIVTGTVARNLTVNTFTRVSGTTTLTTGTGGILNLAIGHLKGAGNLTVSGTGQVVPAISEGIGYTGTITVNSGATLKVDKQLATAGSLVINTGGTLVLNNWIYVTGLTVNGVARAVGSTYSLSDLGLAGTGTGRISVYTRDLSGPPQMFGVNLAGPEFTSGAFWPDTAPVWDYYKSKGLTLIRLPIKWQRLQSPLYAPVNFTKLDQVLTLARDRDMKVIIDLHNYNYYNTDQEVGSTSVPVAALQDFWSQMADHLKDRTEVYGYDIMNEPKNALGLWASTAQAVVDAIRKKDTTHYVFVEGMFAASAWRWPTSSGSLDIHDPVGRLIYSAHSYWDHTDIAGSNPRIYSGDGTYETTDLASPNIAVNSVMPFINWLKTRPYAHGHIGEYGIPNNVDVANWNIELDSFLAVLRENNISGTYWAGGAWGNYPLLCEPRPLVGGPDQPQMAVLEAYNNFDVWTNQDVGAVGVAGSGTYANGTFTLQGSGADIWGTADGFHFAYKKVTGDCTVTARIVSQTLPNSLSMCGVMIRESLTANSAHAYTNDVGGSINLTRRAVTGGATGRSANATGIILPYWVRLVRSGNTFTAYRSPDNNGAPSGWILVNSYSVPMTATEVHAGIVVCSHNNGALSTVVFDNVQLTTP